MSCQGTLGLLECPVLQNTCTWTIDFTQCLENFGIIIPAVGVYNLIFTYNRNDLSQPYTVSVNTRTLPFIANIIVTLNPGNNTYTATSSSPNISDISYPNGQSGTIADVQFTYKDTHMISVTTPASVTIIYRFQFDVLRQPNSPPTAEILSGTSQSIPCQGISMSPNCTGSPSFCAATINFNNCLTPYGIINNRFNLTLEYTTDVIPPLIFLININSENGDVLANITVNNITFSGYDVVAGPINPQLITNIVKLNENIPSILFTYTDATITITYIVIFNILLQDPTLRPIGYITSVVRKNNISVIPPNFNQSPTSLPNIQIDATLDEKLGEIASTTMTIIDIYKYTLCRYTLCNEYIGEPTTSQITILHPDFYPVIKNCFCSNNCACNLGEKLELILSCTCNPPNANANSIASYALLVYFFSALLYGCFDLDFLTRIHYCQFIKDLKKSRFNNFARLFIDPIYGLTNLQKYFIY